MIKFENTEVVGWEAAIRGMRNPKNSWERGDTGFKCGIDRCVCNSSCADYPCSETQTDRIVVGPNDLDLMKRLVVGGPVHAKYRRMITVYVDITAPLYWWKEFDTYKVGTVANSCSTMHKITSEEFDMGSISGERLSDDNHYIMYNAPLTEDDLVISPKQLMSLTIDMLNYLIESYDNEKDQDKKKDIWYSIIQLLPSSYNQKRTIMLNYEVLAGIYPMRKNHKLDEWSEHEPDLVIRQGGDVHYMYPYHGFCDWIKTLPYSELITGDNEPTINTKNITPLDCNSLNAIAGLLNHNGFSNEAGILLNIQNKLEISKEFIDKFNAIGNINAISSADVKIGLDMASQPDFSSCMHPPIEEEIYIEDILTRADVMWYSDMTNGYRVVKSRNTKEPLTEQEQECLKQMWRNQGFRGDVIFYAEEMK